MKLAFVYAGQGAQCAGMGKDLYVEYPTFAQTFDQVADENLKRLCFEADIEELSLTENTQPAMVAFAVSLSAVLRENGILPEISMGLSLGEYSALADAGVFTPKEAVEVAAYRGDAMANAVKGIECGMSAILGMEREALLEVCQESKNFGVVEITNYNCPNQIVIGGEKVAVDEAVKLAMARGAKKAIPLQVSGPFHTSLMTPAGDRLATKFENMNLGDMKFPVIFNSTAKPLQAGETVAKLLELQVQNTVLVEDSLRYIIDEGYDTIVEVGPAKVLAAFIKKIDRKVKVFSVEDVETLETTLAALAK